MPERGFLFQQGRMKVLVVVGWPHVADESYHNALNNELIRWDQVRVAGVLSTQIGQTIPH